MLTTVDDSEFCLMLAHREQTTKKVMNHSCKKNANNMGTKTLSTSIFGVQTPSRFFIQCYKKGLIKPSSVFYPRQRVGL